MATPLAMLKNWIEILGFQALGFLASSATAVIAVIAVPPQVWGEYWLLLSIVQVVSGVGLSWVAQSVSLLARAYRLEDTSDLTQGNP